MTNNKKSLSLMLSASLCVALLPLAGCDKKTDADTTASAPPAPQAQAAQPYVPPTADQLYQLVGPIALFPDKLLAQVLAASSYPDQITAADNWLAQNKNLKGSQLQDAINQQPWDVSVKGVAQFPSVLDQMAHNIPWTSALGDAYVNDPTDVMNAIQVMRQRAASSGNLKNNQRQRIAVAPRAQPAPPTDYAPPPGEPLVYAGPEVIPPPPETIVIEPTEPDMVYVPDYNPGVVYGEPLPVYPGYYYQPPQAYYPPGEIVTAGVITFGVGIAVGALIGHHDWGWDSWGVHWGGPGGGGNWGGPGGGGGWHRPAVVYNNNTYVSRSTTIVNRVTNNYNNSVVNNNNVTRNNFGPGQANNPALANGARPGQPGGGAANFNSARPNFAPQGNPGQPRPNQNALPNGPQVGGAQQQAHARPDFNNMTRPNFNRVPQTTAPLGAATANQLARPGFVHPGANPVPQNEPGRPNFGQPAQNARPTPNPLQQNAQTHVPVQPRHLDMEKPPVNLNQHPFGGNPQQPAVNHPAASAPRAQPFQPPQNVQNRAPEQFQNRPNGGQQMHPEVNHPAPPAAAPAFNRPEPRPQAPAPQPRPQPQPQPQARPPMQAPHPSAPAQNHEQPHHDGNHPDKRNDDHK